jgi:hypothetical protein
MSRKWAVALVLGILLWLVVLVFSILIAPIRSTNRIFFETLMPLALGAWTIAFALLYFRRVQTEFVREGFMVGAFWFAINVSFDQPLFADGPFAMSFGDYYMMDIGLTYLLIPIFTIGLGYGMQMKHSAHGAKHE